MGDVGRRDSVTVKLTGCEDDGGGGEVSDGGGGVNDGGGGVADMVITDSKARKEKPATANQQSSRNRRQGRKNSIFKLGREAHDRPMIMTNTTEDFTY